VAGRDITEGDDGVYALDPGDSLPIARGISELGIISSSSIWTNTDVSFDVAVGGMPFIYAVSDERPYIRQTAPYRKDQFDNNQEPGEQSLTGWWIRSQSSFHSGTGIKFYDPAAGEITAHRFADSRNVDVWTKGQVTLLKETNNAAAATADPYKLISGISGSTNVVIAFRPSSDEIIDIKDDGTNLTTYATTASGIVDIVSNGTILFVANATRIFYQTIGSTSALNNHYNTGTAAVKMAWVKQRLVAGIGTSIYELTGALGTTTLPAAIYTHPNTGWEWTSISEGGSAIYAAGYAGGNGAIYKFTLSTAGVMPTLTSGIIAAQLPIGEYPLKIESYLGYLVIGTNKGVRVAQISDTNGDLSYGPLIIEGDNIGLDFAFRDRFVYVTGGIAKNDGTADTYPGLYRIDLGSELETLRFAFAADVYLDGADGYATSVDFVGNSGQVAFTTSGSNGVVIQHATDLAESGFIKTGKIRYGTLEPKNFKRLIARGNFTAGEMVLSSVATDNAGLESTFDHITYVTGTDPVEVTTNQPEDAQEFLAYKFTLTRDATDPDTGPTFRGYQVKSTIATPRVRAIRFPVYCFDIETDRYNSVTGYEGRAFDRIRLLEDLERTGDVLTWQDLTTGESQQAVIEQISFTRMTPPDRRFDGFGGIIEITIRTV
jgi:hypothetical protein